MVPKSPGINLFGSKWVFKKNLTADGTICRYKARLVARVPFIYLKILSTFSFCENPLGTSMVLYLYIVPSTFNFVWNTHFEPTKFISGDLGTNIHVLLVYQALIFSCEVDITSWTKTLTWGFLVVDGRSKSTKPLAILSGEFVNGEDLHCFIYTKYLKLGFFLLSFPKLACESNDP